MSRTLRLLGFLLLLAVAAALRLWQIDRLPPGFHFDEAFEGLEAWRILTDPTYRPVFLTGNFGVPPLNAYLNALSFSVATLVGGEPGPTAMRVTAALLGVLGVAAVFGLADELRRRDPARLSPALPWLAAGSLAVMRWHLHFSRMGIEPVMVPLVWAGATWLLLRAWRTGAWTAYAACGATLALGMYAYQAAWVIPFLVAATALHLLGEGREAHAKTQRRKEREEGDPPGGMERRWAGLGVAGIVAVIGVTPLALFFLGRPDLLLLRPAQLAIVGQTTSPADSTLLDAVWATAKMFGPLGAPGDLDPRRNLPGAPALNWWQALPFYLGLALALRRVTSPVGAIPMVGLVGLLAPGVVSEYAPHFHRVLGASAPAAILIGWGLDTVWHTARTLSFRAKRGISLPWRRDRRDSSSQTPRNDSSGLGWIGRAMVVTLLLLAGVTTARDYFVRWASLPDLYYAFDVGLWDVGRWAAAQPVDTPVYLTPRPADHATLAFAWRERTAPVTFDGRAVFPLTAAANPVAEQYVVISHEDWRTPLLLPDVLPDATVTQAFTDATGQPYAAVYTRGPDTIPARPPHRLLELPFGDGLTLLGYDLQPADLAAGASAYLQLHWLVAAAPGVEWTVFVHLLDASGAQIEGFDRPAGAGTLPTTRWRPGWRVLDEIEFTLPPDRDPDDLTLRVGLYAADGAPAADGPGVAIPVRGTAP